MNPYYEKSRPSRRPSEPSRGQLDAFAESSESDHAAELSLLIPLAQQLAREAGRRGITIADVREEAARRGILPPLGEGRSLSYLGSLGKRAGLVTTGLTRRSHIEGANANRNSVWVAPAYTNQGSAA